MDNYQKAKFIAGEVSAELRDWANAHSAQYVYFATVVGTIESKISDIIEKALIRSNEFADGNPQSESSSTIHNRIEKGEI